MGSCNLKCSQYNWLTLCPENYFSWLLVWRFLVRFPAGVSYNCDGPLINTYSSYKKYIDKSIIQYCFEFKQPYILFPFMYAILIEFSCQSKIWDFAVQSPTDQNVPASKVSMHNLQHTINSNVMQNFWLELESCNWWKTFVHQANQLCLWYTILLKLQTTLLLLQNLFSLEIEILWDVKKWEEMRWEDKRGEQNVTFWDERWCIPSAIINANSSNCFELRVVLWRASRELPL